MFGSRAKPSWGILLLGIWLIAANLLPMINFRFQGMGTVLQILGIAAGVCLLLGR